MHARDVMARKVVSTTVDISVTHVVELLLSANVSGVPVLDDRQKLCGIITEGDLLRRNPLLFRSHDKTSPHFLEIYVKSHALSVGDCMTTKVMSAAPDTTVSQLAAMMATHQIRRVPIVDGDKLVGIVSRRDLLRCLSISQDAIAQGDGPLELAVATRLESELGLDRGRWAVSVDHGIVALAGPRGSKDEIQAIKIVAQNIRGVCGVIFHTAQND